jgi:hypothetical protein
MKTIFKKFDKRTIVTLPRVTFPGEIKVIENEEDAEAAVDFLLSQEILGVDTETRPSFKKGVAFIVALLQVSTLDVCYLFRLNKLGLSPSVIRLLTDKKVPKIGLSWHDDLLQLHKRGEFEPGLFIDIQDISSDFGILDLSLQKKTTRKNPSSTNSADSATREPRLRLRRKRLPNWLRNISEWTSPWLPARNRPPATR